MDIHLTAPIEIRRRLITVAISHPLFAKCMVELTNWTWDIHLGLCVYGFEMRRTQGARNGRCGPRSRDEWGASWLRNWDELVCLIYLFGVWKCKVFHSNTGCLVCIFLTFFSWIGCDSMTCKIIWATKQILIRSRLDVNTEKFSNFS